MAPTRLGLDEKAEAALSYLLGVITSWIFPFPINIILVPVAGIIFLILEPENYFVRFHAAQWTLAAITFIILTLALPSLWILWSLLRLIVVIIGIIKSLQGELYKFPFIGDLAEQFIKPPPPPPPP
ncbi:DUF4870 domain-containing protein [Infirmifilum sp. SLHALR2]|nr:MAG: hypothetical protein B7L53_06505 [Thermofilum sp. NZ13]